MPSPRSQLSLFGAETTARSAADLEGLLAGPGQIVRLGGTARVSVVVRDEWRARALLGEYAARGLTGEAVPSADEHIGVRTAYAAALGPLAASWLRGALTLPPALLVLDGHRLRLWAIAAGHPDPVGYALPLGASDEPAWAAVGAAMARAGLPAELLGPRAGGPAYRISGRRRLERLAELVGPPPRGVPAGQWPDGAENDRPAVAGTGAPRRRPADVAAGALPLPLDG